MTKKEELLYRLVGLFIEFCDLSRRWAAYGVMAFLVLVPMGALLASIEKLGRVPLAGEIAMDAVVWVTLCAFWIAAVVWVVAGIGVAMLWDFQARRWPQVQP